MRTRACGSAWAATPRHGARRRGAPVLLPLLQTRAAQDIVEEARRRGDGEYFPLLAGQGVGLVRDLPGAAEMVETIVREARTVLAGLPRRVRTA
jgi:NAD(P)H-dependent flavin oxidoreductase YrpB (nitropropane dioxygenase family)